MPHIGAMTTSKLLGRWRERQQEILETLPPDLLAEYRRLDELMRAVRAEEEKNARERKEGRGDAGKESSESSLAEAGRPSDLPGTPFTGFFPPNPRIPLSVHKAKLVEFLRVNGPTMRVEIAQRTHIPPGSLSELLSDNELFEQVQRGIWTLKKRLKKPGTSATTAKKEPT